MAIDEKLRREMQAFDSFLVIAEIALRGRSQKPATSIRIGGEADFPSALAEMALRLKRIYSDDFEEIIVEGPTGERLERVFLFDAMDSCNLLELEYPRGDLLAGIKLSRFLHIYARKLPATLPEGFFFLLRLYHVPDGKALLFRKGWADQNDAPDPRPDPGGLIPIQESDCDALMEPVFGRRFL
jgi:hypothetical protein